MRNKDAIKKQIEPVLPFKTKKQDIGETSSQIREDAFLDTNETKYLKTQDYKDYLNDTDKGVSAFPFQSNFDLSRAKNQSNWEQAGHAIARLIPNTALEVVNQVGGLLDLEDYINSDEEVGNWLSTWATEQKAKIDKATPIFQENPNEALQIGDFAWWMENGTNLVQSATAFVGLGYATGGLSLATLGKGAKALKWLSTLGKTAQVGDKSKKAVRGLSALSNATLLNHAEGYGVGVQVYEQAFNNALKEFSKDENLSNSDINRLAKEEAAKKAESAMNFNKLNILLNLSSASLFLKTPALTRQILKQPNLKRSFKKAGIEGIQESAEESINMIAENQALDEEYTFDKALEDVASREGIEAALLGFIGGAGQTGLTLSGRSIKTKRDSEGNRISANQQLQSRIVDQEKALTDWESLSKAEKFTSVSDAYMNAKEQSELYSKYQKAMQSNDVVAANNIKDKILHHQAYTAFNTGTTEQLLETFKGIGSLSEEEAEERGLDVNTYKKQSNEAIDLINTLEGEFNKASAYLNREQVYSNRAELYGLRKDAEKLEQEQAKVAIEHQKDLKDLDIELESKAKAAEELGEIDELGKHKQALIESLNSYKELQLIENALENNRKRKEQLILEHNEITSDGFQNTVREGFKNTKKRSQERVGKEKVEKEKKVEKVQNETKKANFKKEIVKEKKGKVENNKPDVIQESKTKQFKLTNKELQKQLNKGINSDLAIEEKIAKIQKLQELASNGQMDEQSVREISLQAPIVLEELKQEKNNLEAKESTQKVANANLNTKIKDLASNLKEDFSPKDDLKTKQLQRTEMMLDLISSAKNAGIDTNNFKELGSYVKEVLGEEDFVRLFNQLKGLYITATNNDVVGSYEDIFYPIEKKEEVVINDEVIVNAALPSQVYNMFEGELLDELDRKNKEFIENQGYKFFSNDSIDVKGATILEGHNKIAHLDKKYRKNVDSAKTDRFNVLDFIITKSDLDRNLNTNYDSEILDFNEINVGSKITFLPLDEVVYEDGTIAYSNGDIEKNGKITKGSPLQNTPIGIEYNGKVLKGSFLHLPSWITAETVRGDVAKQKQALSDFRQKVLNSEGGVTVTVNYRSDGWPMNNKDGFLELTKDTMSNADIAVGKDNQFFVGKNKTVEIDKYEAFNGRVYTVYPVNKNKYMASPVSMQKLVEKPEYISSIKNAVKLYLNNNKEDSRVVKLKSELGYDVTNLEGLNAYLSDFIYVDNRKLNYQDFKNYVESQSDKYPLLQITDYTINFGVGKNWGNTIDSLDRGWIFNNIPVDKREAHIEARLDKLEKVLKHNMTLNTSLDLLEDKFDLVLITDEDVEIQNFENYKDFVKEHSYTSNYSITLDNGTTIYTVQPTIQFDMNIGKEIPREIVEEAIETPLKAEEKDTLGIELDLGSFEDFSPMVLTEQQEQDFLNSTPKSLLIQGVPIGLQETIVDHLSASVVEKYLKGDKNAFSYIFEFRNKLQNVMIPAYESALEKEDNKKYRKNLEITKAVLENYSILSNLTLDKLRRLNNLVLDGKTIKTISQDFLEDNIDFEDALDIEEGEVLDYNTWSTDAVFVEDFRDKISIKVKNTLAYIKDIDPNTLEDVKSAYNISKTVPLDTVVNDVSGILAFNNFQEDIVSEPSFEIMMRLLEEQTINKPYLENVIKTLENSPKDVQNQFVKVMSKHYTHHKFGFRGKNGIVFLNSDSNGVNQVIQNKWLTGLYSSDLVIDNGEFLTIDKDKIKNLKVEKENIVNMLQSDEVNDYIKVSNFIEKIGISIDENTLEKLNNTGIYTNGKRQSLLSILTASDGFIKLYLDRLENIGGQDLEIEHPFKDLSAKDSFARELAKMAPNHYANSFKDVRGRTYYGYSQNKFLIDRFKDLKTNKSLLDKLSKQPFTSNSLMLEKLKNPDNLKYYKYYTIDGYSSEGRKGRKFQHLSPAEQEEFKVNLFYSQNKKKSKAKNPLFIVNTFYPTTSDKAILYGYSSLGIDFKKGIQNGTLNDRYINSLYARTVQTEINRILAYQLNPEKYNYEGTEKGAGMFVMFPTLNAIEELWITDKESGVRKLKDINFDASLELLTKTEFKNFLNNLVDNKLDTWREFGFEKIVEEKGFDDKLMQEYIRENKIFKYTGNNIREEAINYVANYLLANTNIYQLFTTDPANYWKSNHWQEVANRENIEANTREDVLGYYNRADWLQEHEDIFDNMGKRLAADVAPGTDPPESSSNYFNIYHAKDTEKASEYLKQYKSILGEKANAYNNINTTDAQELTTLKEHLTIMELNGDINSIEKNGLLKAERQGSLSDIQLGKVLQPMKPRYVSNHWVDGVERRIYIKSSSFPLIKQLTKGLEVDKLRQAMLENNIDRIVYDSALKVGGLNTSRDLYAQDGTFTSLYDDAKINGLSRTGMKIQQEIPYKPNKNTISNPTQLVALITAQVRDVKDFQYSGPSYTGKQIQDKINEKYLELYQLKYKDLIKELEYNPITNVLNIERLQEILRDEGIERDYPFYDLQAFDIENNQFAVPLWQTGVSSKIESMLNSIVDNRIRKHKPRGQSYVLGTNTGFAPVIKETEEMPTDLGIRYDSKWYGESKGKLRPMRTENGKIRPAEVIAPFRFYDENGVKQKLTDFLKSDNTIDTERISGDLLTSIGFRIPTQGLKSMSYIKVVGFLPETSADLILAPSEFIVQMGSDFDADKLYGLMYNASLVGGKLLQYQGINRQKELDNELLDLYLSILKNPSKKVQEKILSPLDFGKLPELANEVYPFINTSDKGISISEEYQMFKYNNARAGAIGIGVFSNDMRFMSNLTGTNVKFITKKGRDLRFKIGGVVSNNLGNPYTNNKKLKTEIIEYFQSLSVDNENEQGLHKLNINQDTFDTIRAMLMSGFEEDIISYFINQPIIRDYVKYNALVKDSLTDFTSKNLTDKLNLLYPVKEKLESSIYLDVTKEALLNNIKGNINNHTQQEILNLFLYLTNKGKELQRIQSSLNTFNAGIGKNLFYSLTKEEQFKELPTISNIKNIEELVGDYLYLEANSPLNTGDKNFINWDKAIKEGKQQEFIDSLIDEGYVPIGKVAIEIDGKLRYRNNIKFIKPKTISGISTIYSTLFNNKIWEEYFPYNNSKVLNTLDKLNILSSEQNTTVNQKAGTSQINFKNIKSYLASGAINTLVDNDIISERNRLFLDTENNISLASIVKDLKDKKLLNNIFINRLELDIRKNVLPSIIKYKANAAENIDERAIYASFYSMFTNNRVLGTYNGIEYTVKKLAQEMVSAQLISGGVQGANQFIKYVPINYLKSLGYYNEVNNNIENFNPNTVLEQIIQHNPSLVYNEEFKEAANSGILNLSKRFVAPENMDFYPDYISVRDSKKLKKFKLYKKDSTFTYEQIDTLGNKDFLEYNFETENAVSIIPNNQVPNTTPTLPTKEELKVDKGLDINSEVISNPEITTIIDKYNLDNGNESKLISILEEISLNSKNITNKVLAKELLKNTDKIKDYRLIINPNLKAEASHNINDKTIKINPTEFDTNLAFEKVYLEEVIHAYTKKAIIENKQGEVNRLNGLRSKGRKAVEDYFKQQGLTTSTIQKKFDTLDSKIKNQEALTKEESELLYPLYNTEEFIGRLFKSKKLQEILNKVEGDKSLWDNIKDFIRDILNSLGIDIKKGSVLDYAMADTISLINTPISESIQGEINKLNPRIRTIEWVEEKYILNIPDTKVINHINNNIDNIIASLGNEEIGEEAIILKYKKDFSPKVQTTDKKLSFQRNINRRVKLLQDNINKLQAQKNYKEAEKLKLQLNEIENRQTAIDNSDSLSSLLAQGKQDMQEIEEIFDRQVTVSDAIYIKEITDYWSNLDTLLFDEDDLSSVDIPEFRQLENEAKQWANKLHKIENRHAEELIKKYGNATSIDEIFEYYQDINQIAANTLDISRFNNPLLNSLLINLKDANNQALDESQTLLKDLEEQTKRVTKALKSEGFDSKELFEIFRQKDNKGRYTGHLTKRYKVDFIKDRSRFLRNLSKNDNMLNYTAFLKWSRDNTLNLDLELLFTDKKEGRKDYIKSLKDKLGKNQFDEIYNDQKKKVERYKEQKENFEEYLMDAYRVDTLQDLASIPRAANAHKRWVATHSPFIYNRQRKKGLNENETNYNTYNNHKYLTLVPNSTEEYDSNFSQIESNQDIYDFYKYYEEIDKQLQNLLPEKERIALAYNGIPYLSNIAMNAYREKGMKAGLNPIKDAINKSIRISNLGTADINPINDRVYRNVDINLTKDNQKEIKIHVALRTIEYQEENNGTIPPDSIINEWISDKKHELAQKQSYDLPSVLRMYAMSTLIYTHKARIEDNVKLIQNLFERQREIRRDSKGEVILKEDGTADIREASNSFKNTKHALDYTAKTFYGITKENEGVTNKKVYTTEEKEKIKEIDKKLISLETLFKAKNINEEDYNNQVEELEDIKDSLGGLKVWSKKGDGLLKYVQLKGMGWNFMSSIANVGFGFISNYVEAAGGLLYSRKALNKSYAMVRHSMVKNASFDRYGNNTAIKIRSMMDKWDVLKDASTELYDDPLGIKLSSKHQWLEPYNLTKRTEYINQAPLMIALMLEKKVKVGENEVDIWEGYDENGNWKEEYGEEPKEEIKKLRLKLDQIIKSNHGNYDPVSALAVKNRFLGRAVSQFRTWMFEGVANRFEKKKYDDLLEEYRKGRYITTGEYITEYGLQAPLFILKGIVRSITFGKILNNSDFSNILDNDKFDEIDAANMRKLMSEVSMYIGIYASYLLLSTITGDLDDDEDKMKKYMVNLLINQGLRLKTDITFYVNPNEFRNLMRDLIPVTSLIADATEWLVAVQKAVVGEDIIKSGVYSGHSRLTRETVQMLPFGTQVYRTINYGQQTFD